METAANYYYRKRYGRGFQYFDAEHSKVLCPKQLKRFKTLAVPPMWNEVQIARSPSSKVQATGRDARGRKQYIYSDAWQRTQQRKKFAKMLKFSAQLPSIRQHCINIVGASVSFDKQHVLATMVGILDDTGIRIGNQRYTQENQTHGLTTLRRKHLSDTQDCLALRFVGKSGKAREVTIEDQSLIEHIKAFAAQPGYNLFRYKNSQNKWQDVCSEDINEFIKCCMDEDFSAKDFRTWFASCLAVDSYYRLQAKLHKSRKTPENQVLSSVSKILGNTVAICKAYYVHPQILDKIANNKMPKLNTSSLSDEAEDASLSELELLTMKLIN